LNTLIILGSGTGVPSLKRNASGILVQSGGLNLVFDTGMGTLKKLLELGFTYHDPDCIFYSHFHPDHIHDLAVLLFAARNPASLRIKDLFIYGPVGLKKYCRRLMSIYGSAIAPESYRLKLKEVSPKQCVTLACGRIETCKTSHVAESLAYRLDTSEGKSLVYTADTDFCVRLVKFARGADILITETSFPDDLKVKGHLTPHLAARLARQSNARKLILTHFYPVCAQYDIINTVKKTFFGEVVLAEDLMKIVF
jgi:ribonuclease BN (tRNA processing enzyme)